MFYALKTDSIASRRCFEDRQSPAGIAVKREAERALALMGNLKEAAPDVAQQVTRRCFDKELLLFKGGRWNNVDRFMPAMVITESLFNQGIDIFEEALKSVERDKS